MHIWLRAEERANEQRSPLTPEGAAKLIAAGHRVSVESSAHRCLPTTALHEAGAEIAQTATWPDAPDDAIILGLKELPISAQPLRHAHIMFGHAFKGQHDGPALLRRFKAGNGTLLDIEYLTNPEGRRLAAFGYWAGFAGAAVSLLAYAAAKHGDMCGPVGAVASSDEMVADVKTALDGATPRALVIGALGRVGSGARDLCARVGVTTTDWDMAETASGGPFPQILDHEVFLNSILAGPNTPPFVPKSALTAARTLRVIGDIACDPGSDYNPIPLYDQPTSWANPVVRVANDPILDIMAIDNLPSLMPAESTHDFAAQLLPVLLDLDKDPKGVWARARATFHHHSQPF